MLSDPFRGRSPARFTRDGGPQFGFGAPALDGDAPIGIAIGAGTDVAIESAGAVFMSASTVIVAANAQLLRGLDL
jgi:hypothetical protein